jgi:hypothetical protein
MPVVAKNTIGIDVQHICGHTSTTSDLEVRSGTYSPAENAAWDNRLSFDDLVKKAAVSPPSESWYKEEFTR